MRNYKLFSLTPALSTAGDPALSWGPCSRRLKGQRILPGFVLGVTPRLPTTE